MRYVSSEDLSDFASIYEDDVELVSVRSQATADSEQLARTLIEKRQIPPNLRWVQEVDDRSAPAGMLPPTVDDDVRDSMIEQIRHATDVMGELVGCERVGVRLETLNAPMCPRFHVDHVHCRLLVTLSGAGTEWISNGDVDWERFADYSNDLPPLQAGTQIRQLETGSWSLLKGGAWGDVFDGIVHRSPHAEGERLLLALDPIL